MWYLAAVPGAGVSDLLDEVEDEPRRGDDHQYNEGDGDENQRSAVDVLGWTTLTNHHRHQHGLVPLQRNQDLLPERLCDHYRYRISGSCRKTESIV